ncbi:MAG: SET domain-containing protein [Rhizobiales bacterium]|nr:SET domain-containing protein [Hyphomicrobiales bacterium]
MSYTNFDLIEVRAVRPDHKAIYARDAIPAGELLGFFDGKSILVDLEKKDELDDYWWRQSVHLKLIGSKLLCLIPEWEPEGVDYLNHSCHPNARVEEQLYVFADRDIQVGEEITADYRTFNLVPQNIRCWCEGGQCVI